MGKIDAAVVGVAANPGVCDATVGLGDGIRIGTFVVGRVGEGGVTIATREAFDSISP